MNRRWLKTIKKQRPLSAREQKREVREQFVDSYGKWLEEHKGHPDEPLVRELQGEWRRGEMDESWEDCDCDVAGDEDSE